MGRKPKNRNILGNSTKQSSSITKMGKKSKKHDIMAKKAKQSSTGADVNPFEIRYNKQRHSILGRQKKKDRGLPGVSRNKAVKKREQSLLKEYKQINKVNSFVDRRIGENDATADPEERAMARFAKEWRKNKKSTMFNLNDEDLTHMGKSISEIECFDDSISNSEDEDANLTGEFIKKAHFGGFMTMKNANTVQPEKSHKEIMQELITETKKQKYERQSEREANENLTDKLDEQWKLLQTVVGKSKQASNFEATKADDSYDIAVKSLKFEVKGKATDRLKSEEELKRESMQRIATLEAERQKRMIGPDQLITLKKKHISADSLDDGIALDSEHEEKEEDPEDGTEEQESDELGSNDEDNSDSNGYVVDDSDKGIDNGDVDNDNDEGNEDEDDQNNDKDCGEESDSSSENIYEGMFSEDSESEINFKIEDNEKNTKVHCGSKQTSPFAKAIPSTLEELDVLFSNKSTPVKLNILQHLIKTNHPSLDKKNCTKMETLFTVLLQHLSDICSTTHFDSSMVDALVPILYELLKFSPDTMSRSLLDIMSEKREMFLKQCKAKKGKGFPSLATLMLFKLVSIYYSTSDFHHPVVTSAELFMSQILVMCKVSTLQDISRGLFICNLFLEYVSYAKRFVPEAVDFLKSILPQSTSVCNNETSTNLLSVTKKCETVGKMSIKWLLQDAEIPASSETSLTIYNACLCILNNFAKLYVDLPSFGEIFSGVHDSIDSMMSQDLFECLKNSSDIALENINQKISKKSLQEQSKRVKSLKMYEPRIQADFTGKKQRPTMSAKKAERQKLLYKYKKEFKGAVREIRRDNQYISRVQLNDQLEKDNERKQKLKRLYQDLAQQEGEFKRYKKRR